MIRILFVLVFFSSSVMAQSLDDQVGGWYMYFWNTKFKDSQFGIQGDIQHRNWAVAGDLEQLLLRGGFTYSPKNNNVKFTLGYGHITSGAMGKDDKSTSTESRIYQEALLPHKVGNRFYFTHRFRFEQRWVADLDTRTRYRYNLFLNVPLNQPDLKKGAVYIALYNELFVNGQKGKETNNFSVELFDRNRFYSGLGYSLADNLRMQGAFMTQTTNSVKKRQIQLSLHHAF